MANRNSKMGKDKETEPPEREETHQEAETQTHEQEQPANQTTSTVAASESPARPVLEEPRATSTPLTSRNDPRNRPLVQRERKKYETRTRNQLFDLADITSDAWFHGLHVRHGDELLTIRQAAERVANHDFGQRQNYIVSMDIAEFASQIIWVRDDNRGHNIQRQVHLNYDRLTLCVDNTHQCMERLDTIVEMTKKLKSRADQTLTNTKKSEQYAQISAVGELERRKRVHDAPFMAGKRSLNNNFIRKIAETHGLTNQIDLSEQVTEARCPRCGYNFTNDESNEDEEDQEQITREEFETPAKRNRRDQDHDESGPGNGSNLIPVN